MRCVRHLPLLLLLRSLSACTASPPEQTTQPLLALPAAGGTGCTVRWTLPWPEVPDGALRWEDCLRPDQPIRAADSQRVRLLSGDQERWSHEVGRLLPCTGGWWTDPTPTRLLLSDGRPAVEIQGRFGGLPCPDAPALSEGSTRLILLPDLPPTPAPTCAYTSPLPATTPSALWLLEDHLLGKDTLQMALERRADQGWLVTTRWRDQTSSAVFWLSEEADRPGALGFPARCPAADAPLSTLAMPLLEVQHTGPGQRGRVLQPAAVRATPAADGALLAVLAAGSTLPVLSVTDTLRAVPGTGAGHPDAQVQLPDGREGWVHLADMAVSAVPLEEVGGRGSGLWLAEQPGAAWWGKLADFEHLDAQTWLVGAQAAAPIAHRAWTGSEILRATHLRDDDGDRQREVLVVTEAHIPEAGMGGYTVAQWAEPALTLRGSWHVPVPSLSGLVVTRTGQARVTAGVLVLDTVDLSTATGERLTVYLDAPGRAPETTPLLLRGTVRRAGRAHAAPSAAAPGQGQLWEGDEVEVREVYGGPLDAWRQPAWVRIDQGWLPADALALEADFLAVTLAGDEAALVAFPWAQVEPRTGQ